MIKMGLAVCALQLGVVASANAGGAALLRLPIEGVTTKNSEQCAALFAEKFAPVLTYWNNGDVKMLKDGSTNLVQLRPDRGQISLSDVENALKGSPFSIQREQLEYISCVQLRIGKIADHEKLVAVLATLDGKNLHTHTVEDTDGSLLVTLNGPHLERGTSVPLLTHKRLTNYLSKNSINLIAISWGNKLHRGAPFGARPIAEAVVKK